MKGLDLRKFTKVGSDEKTTTLAHPDGHTITIAHKALPTHMRSDLDKLPMKKGGEVSDKIDKSKSNDKHIKKDPTQEHLGQGDQMPNKIEKKVVSGAKKEMKMADGGKVAGNEETAFQKQLADAESQQASENRPFGTPEPAMQQQAPAQPIMAEPAMQQQAPASAPPQDNSQPRDISPDIQEAYQKQLKGIEQLGAAQAGQAGAESQALKAAIPQQITAEQEFGKHLNDLMQEHQNFIQDVQNQHIDPQHYMSSMGTGQKVATGIGLILGGIGAGGLGIENPGVKFLNQQIDRDIQAQASELGKKENLLNANMRQFGNIRDAADMTRVMQAGVVANQLRQAATQAQSPIAKANALQAAGQLEAQYAPMMQQLAMRKTLMGAQNGTSQADPASFVQWIVPKEHQKAVFDEIGRAQDTRRMGDDILKSFDAAAVDTRPMSGGALKNVVPGVTSPHVLALHQAMQPTFKDLEGTVRQAAMDNTFHNITPQLGDNDSTIAIKRKALEGYLKSKEAAPTAKGYGIDLDRFASTMPSPIGRMAPEHQKFADWAKKNPNDPRSQVILKKLGL